MSTKLVDLKTILGAILPEGLVVACSGGLDSRLLVHTALMVSREYGLRPPLALHVAGPHMSRAESERAVRWAESAGVDLRVVRVNPLTEPQVAANARDRCYWCKKRLFEMLGEVASDLGCATLADGSNTSDRGQYRPGMRALAELGIRSPLAEADLTKADIHACAAATGLADPDQRPRPCLLTRLPYDTPVSESVLRELEVLEARVDAFFAVESGPDFRLRFDEATGVTGTTGVGTPGVTGTTGLCLHLEPGLSSERLAALQELLPDVRVLEMASLSGYYDRVQ